MQKTVAQTCRLLKILSKKPWGSSKEILLIYYFSLPDEEDENKIYQFLSFSVYYWKFWLGQGGLSVYGSHKGDEKADTDLMFQFFLPNRSMMFWVTFNKFSNFSTMLELFIFLTPATDHDCIHVVCWV